VTYAGRAAVAVSNGGRVLAARSRPVTRLSGGSGRQNAAIRDAQGACQLPLRDMTLTLTAILEWYGAISAISTVAFLAWGWALARRERASRRMAAMSEPKDLPAPITPSAPSPAAPAMTPDEFTRMLEAQPPLPGDQVDWAGLQVAPHN
jgi:hypothetical protein